MDTPVGVYVSTYRLRALEQMARAARRDPARRDASGVAPLGGRVQVRLLIEALKPVVAG